MKGQPRFPNEPDIAELFKHYFEKTGNIDLSMKKAKAAARRKEVMGQVWDGTKWVAMAGAKSIWDGTKWVFNKGKEGIKNMIPKPVKDSKGQQINKGDTVEYKAAKNYPASGVKVGDLVKGVVIGLTGDQYKAKSSGNVTSCRDNQIMVQASRGMFCKDANQVSKVA